MKSSSRGLRLVVGVEEKPDSILSDCSVCFSRSGASWPR